MSEALTIHPPIPPCPSPSGFGWAYEDWHEDRANERKLSARKRLTDPELAAEVHAAAHEYDMDWVQTGQDEGPLAEIFSTLGRFARRPHYDE